MADCVLCERPDFRCDCIEDRRTALLAVLDAAEAVVRNSAARSDYYCDTCDEWITDNHAARCSVTILALAVGEARRVMG